MCSALRCEVKQAYGAEALLMGAEAIARGGTYIGAAESSQYIFQNYAFLGKPAPPRLAFSTFRLLNEVKHLTAAFSFGNFALGVLNIQDSAGYQRDNRNNLLGGKIEQVDNTVYAAAGLGNDTVGLGLRVKYLSKLYSGLNVSATGFGLDLAGFWQVGSVTFGLGLNNLAGGFLQWSTGAQEQLLPEYIPGLRWSINKQVALFADAAIIDGLTLAHGGVEYRPTESIALRLGANQYSDFEENQEIVSIGPVAGVGLNLANLYFDYAYSPSNSLQDTVTHFFTFTCRFEPTTKTKKRVAGRPASVKAEQESAEKSSSSPSANQEAEDEKVIYDLIYNLNFKK
ncbi:hypothetical protein NO2_0847 [Candidatus Termititenax persephonae]|uniref:Outer membrane protein n=1 Tax=Candidatus Termititenax persephonae TaxID=2218525 RepID=A0A388TH82_9BACT|nr:hypothetical protein NO2_0847 [Candidatus Termititenax persephonae]